MSFLKKYPSLESKIILIENIVSPKFICEQAKVDIEELNTDTFNLVSVGRLCHAKGYDLAIPTLKKLHSQGYTNIRWYVVGYGGDEQMLKNLIKENNLEEILIYYNIKNFCEDKNFIFIKQN